MHLTKINIDNIASISNLQIEFNRRMNIICGPNGIGKTTILECVAQSFSGQFVSVLKRRADSSEGQVKAWISDEKSTNPTSFKVTEFLPKRGAEYATPIEDQAKNLLSLKIARTFNHQSLNAINKDPDRDVRGISNDNIQGLNISEVKNWFINRHLFSAHEGSLTGDQLHNIQLAKNFFSILNPDYQFSRVEASSNEILIKTPSGEIFYEYLSSGFKSCLSILIGIIKELEFRFKRPGIRADEFAGVILIDEIELHLHPDWQAKIAKTLTIAFPNSQFIVSTHSPHVIQAAQPEEVIALQEDNGQVSRRPLPETHYGFQGWTIEEVLRDVMGMSDTRTTIYHEALKNFEISIDNENYSAAQKAYNKLDKLLHPENHLRKLLAFQLGALKG